MERAELIKRLDPIFFRQFAEVMADILIELLPHKDPPVSDDVKPAKSRGEVVAEKSVRY